MHVEVEQELIQSGAVSSLDIQFAKEESRKNQSSILINLLANHSVEDSYTVTKILAQHYKIPLISLNKVTPPPKLIKLCKPEQARRLCFLPISEQGNQIVVGMVDPTDLNFTDEIRAPVSGADAAKGIMHFIDSLHKTLHLGGPEAMSRYDFGRLLYTALDCPEHITARRQAEVQMPAPRPRNVTLDSRLAFSNGYHPRPVEEALSVELPKIIPGYRRP